MMGYEARAGTAGDDVKELMHELAFQKQKAAHWQQEAESLQRQLNDVHGHLSEACQLLDAKDREIAEKSGFITVMRSSLLRLCDLSGALNHLLHQTSTLEEPERAHLLLPAWRTPPAPAAAHALAQHGSASGSDALTTLPLPSPSYCPPGLDQHARVPIAAARGGGSASDERATPQGGDGDAPRQRPGSAADAGGDAAEAPHAKRSRTRGPAADCVSGERDSADAGGDTGSGTAHALGGGASSAHAARLHRVHSCATNTSLHGSEWGADGAPALQPTAEPSGGGRQAQRSIMQGAAWLAAMAGCAPYGSAVVKADQEGGLEGKAGPEEEDGEDGTSDEAVDSLLQLATIAARQAQPSPRATCHHPGLAPRHSAGVDAGHDSDERGRGAHSGGEGSGGTRFLVRGGSGGGSGSWEAPPGGALRAAVEPAAVSAGPAPAWLPAARPASSGGGHNAGAADACAHGAPKRRRPSQTPDAPYAGAAPDGGARARGGGGGGGRASWFRTEILEKIAPAVREAIATEWRERRSIAVTCADLYGTLYVNGGGELAIRLADGGGTVVSPIRFEEMAGKKTARNWQQSIRLVAYTMTGEPGSALVKLGHFTRIVGLATER